jgi:hypothetical protein
VARNQRAINFERFGSNIIRLLKICLKFLEELFSLVNEVLFIFILPLDVFVCELLCLLFNHHLEDRIEIDI